jgi:hypothetical protein
MSFVPIFVLALALFGAPVYSTNIVKIVRCPNSSTCDGSGCSTKIFPANACTDYESFVYDCNETDVVINYYSYGDHCKNSIRIPTVVPTKKCVYNSQGEIDHYTTYSCTTGKPYCGATCDQHDDCGASCTQCIRGECAAPCKASCERGNCASGAGSVLSVLRYTNFTHAVRTPSGREGVNPVAYPMVWSFNLCAPTTRHPQDKNSCTKKEGFENTGAFIQGWRLPTDKCQTAFTEQHTPWGWITDPQHSYAYLQAMFTTPANPEASAIDRIFCAKDDVGALKPQSADFPYNFNGDGTYTFDFESSVLCGHHP